MKSSTPHPFTTEARNWLVVLLVLLFSFSQIAAQQNKTLNFIHLTMNEGLSNNTVHVVFQDSKNFIWFGTEDGLDRFDGYGFTIFRNEKTNPRSISDNYVTCMIEDKDGFLWIGTSSGGLNKYDRKTNSFTSYKYEDKNPNSLSDNFVNAIYEDKQKRLWVGTANAGLDLFDREKGIFIHHPHDPNNPKSICSNSVAAILEDKEGNLWVGSKVFGLELLDRKKNEFSHFPTPFGEASQKINGLFEDSDGGLWIGTINGLFNFDKKTKTFKPYWNQSNDPYSLSNNNINQTIVEDRDKNFWIGTNDGLNYFDRKANRFYNWKNDKSNSQSLSSNNTLSLCLDKQGILWIGSSTTGVDKNAYRNIGFKNYTHSDNESNSLPARTVRTIFTDRDDNVWVGMISGGLCKLDKKTNGFIQYKHNDKDPNSISSDEVTSISQDHDGNMWIGCWAGGGLNMLAPGRNKFVHYMHSKDDPNSYIEESGIVQKIFDDSFGRLWIGSNGVDRYDRTKKIFIHHQSEKDNPISLGSNWVQSAMVEDLEGNVWIGSWGGLSKLLSPKITHKDPFDDKAYIFENYSHNQFDTTTICDNRIISLCVDNKGRVWAGTYGSGIVKIEYITDPQTKQKKATFTNYAVRDGLPNDVAFAVLPDKHGNIWVGTNNGLSKFDPEKKTFRNFHTENGIVSNQFFWGASCMSKSGMMYMGGVNGFNAFNPDSLFEDHFIPPVVITDFKIFNQPVRYGEDSRFKTNICEASSLELSYKDEIISFEFSSLDFNAPEKNRYAYMLEGYNRDWVQIDAKHRYITFMNLDPGTYTLKVKGTNSDGIWNPKITTLTISIKPPFWKTWWFRLIMIVIGLSLWGSFYRYRISRIEAQKHELEKQVEARTSEIKAKNEELASQTEQLATTNKELEKLSLVANYTDNAVMIMDGKGNLEWVNDGFVRLFEHTLKSFKAANGKNLLNYRYTDENLRIIHSAFEKHESVVFEMQIETKTGKQIWTQVALTPIEDFNGLIYKLIAVVSDITKIKKAEKEILQQNEKINGSIRYAKTIQEAILTFRDDFADLFQSFIIYKPKDIVSGDFYWFTRIPASETEKEKIVIAVADCTGHGVPGAFMSMVGSRLISEIVLQRSIHSPKKILDALYKDVRIILRQDQTKNSDGMDIGVCLMQKTDDGFELSFSGAKSELFVFNRESKQIEIHKSDKISIGGYHTKREFLGFSEVKLNLKSGDQFYMMTDGIIDQNDNDRIRFGTKRMSNLLEEAAQKEFSDQKKLIDETILSFQFEESQRDDMTLIGIKIV